MKINTKHFGEIEINENDIINFKEGIPAFEDIKKFIIINNSNDEIPFKWLQAIDNPDLAFVIVNPFIFVEGYEFTIPDKAIEELGIEDINDVAIFTIAVVPEKTVETTINLSGPIIINTKNNRAKQLVFDKEGYNLKYKIFKSPQDSKE